MALKNTWQPGDTGWNTAVNLNAQASAINFYSNVNIATAATATLDSSAQQWVFTGTVVSTWTLPPISGNTGLTYTLCNRSTTITAAVTVNAAGSDMFYNHAATAASFALNPGGYLQIVNDGTYWCVLRSYAGVSQLTGVVYSQSSVYGAGGLYAADYPHMNDGLTDGAAGYTGTNTSSTEYIKADCGSTKTIDHLVLGYDVNSNLPGGFGPAYLQSCPVQGSTDNSTWTAIGTTPASLPGGSPNTGLFTMSVNASYRYVQILPSGGSNYIACTEFQVWGH